MRALRSLPAAALRRGRRYAGSTAQRAQRLAATARARYRANLESISWRSAMRSGRKGAFGVELLRGIPDAAALPVIMCLWNRPQRIDDILEQLDAQQAAAGLRLLLWNNQPADDEHYRQRIAAFSGKGSLASVEYHLSASNIGGMGRFFLARRLWRGGSRGHFIMLDDDQDVTPAFVTDLSRRAAPHEYGGWWAWNYLDSHWNRTETPAGASADYVGTGGSICDIAIVEDDAFFTGLPRRFAFLEDQWLCAFARAKGWTLRKIDTDIRFVLHESNQFHGMAELKDEFRRYLIETFDLKA